MSKSFLRLPWITVLTLTAIAVADLVLVRHVSAAWLFPLAVFTLVPGRLLLGTILIKPVSRLNTWLYSAGLGLALLQATGLVINILGRTFFETAPLTQLTILIVLHAEILMLAVGWALRHRASKPIPFTRVRFRPLDILTTILVAIVVLACIGGANLLNNGGSNWLAMAALGTCAVLPIYTVLLRKKLSTLSYVTVLAGMSLVLLFTNSLRSHFLVGSDVLNEFRVAQVVAGQHYWSIGQVASTYNACLSITILPTMLQAITGQDNLSLFRVVFQVIFSLSPLLIFCLARQYLKTVLAFLAALAFMGFANYTGSMPNHIRQEVALLFFALTISMALSTELPRYARKLLALIFASSMVVAHYSTSYIAVLIFLVAAACDYLVYLQRGRRLDTSEVDTIGRPRPIINFRLTGIILLFTVFWYSQIIHTSGGPIAYVTKVASQMLSGGYENQQADQTSLKDQFNIFHKSSTNEDLFEEYVKEQGLRTPGYEPVQLPQSVTEPMLKPNFLNAAVKLAAELLKKSYKFIVIFGTAWAIWLVWRKRDKIYGAAYTELLIGCVAVIGLSFVIPSFTVNYDQERLFQQLLVLLAVPFVIFAIQLTKWLPATLRYNLLGIFLGAYLLTSTSFIAQLTGGYPKPVQQNNSGTDYNRYYVHASELAAGRWMLKVHRYQPIYADTYAFNRLNFLNGNVFVTNTLVPSKISPGAFVYYDYGNTVANITYQPYENRLLILNTPTEYLNQNLNNIYSNTEARVYARK